MPDSDYIEDMDPLMKLWLYESWIEDLEEKNEFAKNYTILQGSFTNPEMAREMIKKENPEHVSSDEDFSESIRWMEESQKKSEEEDSKNKGKRRRRRILRK